MSASLEQVIAALKAGSAAVFPTDTVYGLGVAVEYTDSPCEVSRIKRRDPDKPIAWLVGDASDLDRYGMNVSSEAQRLAVEGWPGALTIIVKASGEVPAAFQSRQGTIGLRMPAGDVALELIREVGPLAASSANRAGGSTPCAFQAIDDELLDEVAAAFEDDSQCGGVASTVIDATGDELVVLRN